MFMMSASLAFYLITGVVNDSDFTSGAFLSRFVFGFGAGLLRSVLIVARAQSKQGQKDVQARDYFKWHMQAEAFGYFLGPLLIFVSNHSRWENGRTTFWLFMTNTIVWCLFTLCFAENFT